MTIDKTINGTSMTLALTGRLDTMTSPQLESEVKADIADLDELIFDFAGLEYISSAGLRVMLSSHKTMMRQGTMIIRNVSDEIMEIFEVTGFTDILNIEE